MSAKLKLIIFFCSIFLCHQGNLAISAPVTVGHAKIVLVKSKSRALPDNKKNRKNHRKEFKKACSNIGRALTVGKGPWGFGVFGSFSCYNGKRRISGKKTRPNWVVEIVDGIKQTQITIYRLGKTKLKVSSVTMPPSEFTHTFLSDVEFVDLVSYSLMDGMPMGMMVSKSMLTDNPPTFKGRYPRAGRSYRFKHGLPDPPEELMLYTLDRNVKRGTWDAEVVGTAKVAKLVEPKVVGKKKKKRLKGGKIHYEGSSSLSRAAASGAIWAQNSKGPGMASAELGELINDAHLNLSAAAKGGRFDDFMAGDLGSLADMFIDSIAGGYLGLRYGLQVIPGDDIQSDTSIFSLLVEIRGGPLKGMRYYYDKVPEVKRTETVVNEFDETETEEETSITWSRHVVGFSWGFGLGDLVDQVTFDPKIGIWTYNSTLISSYAEDGETVASVSIFDLGTTVSVALEVGLEWLSDWYTVRGWYAIDSGVSLVETGGTITSNRFGIDGFFEAGPMFSLFGFPVKTALLAFYFYENVSIESSSVDPDAALEEGEVEITGIEYESGYAGAGVLISW